jgi:hypothetical protein
MNAPLTKFVAVHSAYSGIVIEPEQQGNARQEKGKQRKTKTYDATQFTV